MDPSYEVVPGQPSTEVSDSGVPSESLPTASQLPVQDGTITTTSSSSLSTPGLPSSPRSPSPPPRRPSPPPLALAYDISNLAGEVAHIAMSRLACDVHEHCDGSCGPDGRPLAFPAMRVGGPNQARLHAQREEFKRSELPLVKVEKEEAAVVVDPAAAERFRYEPIDSTRGEIRVLRVREAVFRDDAVEAELRVINLDDPARPAFTTLSYCWGDPTFNRTIVCDGRTLPVNASLLACLRRHRRDRGGDGGRPEWLWADAVCINQADRAELSAQIRLMGRIYGEARVVYVDLGDGPDYFHLGVELLARLKVVAGVYGQGVADTRAPRFNETFGIPPFEHDCWRALFRIFSAPWFLRTWTIQEIVLAGERRLRFGRFAFDYVDLARAFELVSFQRGPLLNLLSPDSWTGMSNFQRTLRIDRDFKRGALTPTEVLWRTRDCLVSDPRDRVIALLGLISHNKREAFDFDYGWPVAKLFYEFALYVLKNWGFAERVAMLSYAGLHLRSNDVALTKPVKIVMFEDVKKAKTQAKINTDGQHEEDTTAKPETNASEEKGKEPEAVEDKAAQTSGGTPLPPAHYFPSWAPDWLAATSLGPAVFAILREEAFCASADSTPAMYALGDFDRHDAVLTQMALPVGRVVAVSLSLLEAVRMARAQAKRDAATGRERGEGNAAGEEGGEGDRKGEGKKQIGIDEYVKKIYSDNDIRWLAWYKSALAVLEAAMGTTFSADGPSTSGPPLLSRTLYPDPFASFAITILGGDQYIGKCATPTSVPIEDPARTLAAVVDSIERGEESDLLDPRSPLESLGLKRKGAKVERKVEDEVTAPAVPAAEGDATVAAGERGGENSKGEEAAGNAGKESEAADVRPKTEEAETVEDKEQPQHTEEELAALIAASPRVTAMFKSQAIVAMRDRLFAVTDTGHMALVPLGTRPMARAGFQAGRDAEDKSEAKIMEIGAAADTAAAEKGDLIVLLGGAPVPFVVRDAPDKVRPDGTRQGRRFQLVGDAYVEGIMQGQFAKSRKFPGDWEPLLLV